MSDAGRDQQDPTRKQRREAARAERRAAEQAARGEAVRRKRLAQLGAAVAVVAVVLVVVLIATSGGGKGNAVAPSSTKANQEAAAVTMLLAGTPQEGDVLGSSTAPVTLQYFGDLECPICRDFSLGALPAIIRNWVKTGKLRIEYRALSTATGKAEQDGAEPEGMFNKQQAAALAAGKQSRAWDYIELFYREQGEEATGYVTEKYLQGLAQQVSGLDVAKWGVDRGDQAFQHQLAKDNQEATSSGLSGTPAFLIGKTHGQLHKFEYSSLTDASGFERAFEAALHG